MVDESIRRKRDWFRRADARVKFVAILAFVVVSALLTRPELIMVALLAALALVVSTFPKPRVLAGAYLGALPLSAFASISVALASGLDNGVAMFARTSACVLPLLALITGTEPFELFSGLRDLKVPARIAHLLMLTQRFVLLLSEELVRMKVARRARAFAGGKHLLDRYGLSVLANTAGMVLVRSSYRADRVHDGLRSRGFAGESFNRGARRDIAGPDAALACCMLAVSGLLCIAQLGVIM